MALICERSNHLSATCVSCLSPDILHSGRKTNSREWKWSKCVKFNAKCKHTADTEATNWDLRSFHYHQILGEQAFCEGGTLTLLAFGSRCWDYCFKPCLIVMSPQPHQKPRRLGYRECLMSKYKINKRKAEKVAYFPWCLVRFFASNFFFFFFFLRRLHF